MTEDAARLETAFMECAHRKGSWYLGEFVGTTEAKKTWVEDKVDSWVAGVIQLEIFAHLLPDTAYAFLTTSLQQECQFLQRVTPGISPLFVSLEKALREDFLPDLFRVPK